MNEHERLSVFQAQTENVRELKRAWAHVNRQINVLLIQKNTKAAEINTKILALIYCALAEAVFSKLIHTPHGLELDEIDQVKNAVDTRGIKFGWTKCAELAIRRVNSQKSSYHPNVLKKLFSSEIEEKEHQMLGWTIEHKIKQLLTKRSYFASGQT